MASIARQCLLECGSGVGKVFKGGYERYEEDEGRVLSRIRMGVGLFPVLALDTEGEDANYV